MVPSPLTSITPALSQLESEFPGTGPQPVELSKRQGNLESRISAFTPHNNSNGFHTCLYACPFWLEKGSQQISGDVTISETAAYFYLFCKEVFHFLKQDFSFDKWNNFASFFLYPQKNFLRPMWQIKGTTWNDGVIFPISVEGQYSEIIRFHNVKNCTETQHDLKLTYRIFVSGYGEQ